MLIEKARSVYLLSDLLPGQLFREVNGRVCYLVTDMKTGEQKKETELPENWVLVVELEMGRSNYRNPESEVVPVIHAPLRLLWE